MLKVDYEEVPGVSRAEIEGALTIVRQFMNTIQECYKQTTTHYQGIALSWDADQVVALLKRGLRYEELQREQKIAWNDLESFRWPDA